MINWPKAILFSAVAAAISTPVLLLLALYTNPPEFTLYACDYPIKSTNDLIASPCLDMADLLSAGTFIFFAAFIFSIIATSVILSALGSLKNGDGDH